ncbi:rRNA methyltransferase [Corynebacterium sp. HMSC067D03]|uniref:tRNA (cytidine(34)-2'-O)-methyltransferase n=1 Tax=Corynebacterium TaxID=1716 RepID=UPI0008A2F5FA|nr:MULTISPECIES: tRNA (cytidine(34)-2'-O)-methyltransferase [Corynebacterium]MDK8240464.1 tRNA (cytidine(34)-2'-O)-methyltransferase [Corynebacterium coyleae]OFL14466.1 rRNA methyltransferase [Corynebacterium sp. HMSC067D03]OHQ53803.1 rRNA methyltransferase [Corynebacterium sp. HMSC070H05]PLA38933.1 tRNA (cytidine(34)-2'-O)-methyltransferase [Corynebacterium coyleae]
MCVLHIIYDNPAIGGNAGAAIRLAANTGAQLHFVEPLGFNFDDKHLKRAGLDYHDLADVVIHPNIDVCFDALEGSRIFAFTAHTDHHYHEVQYQDGDALLFGNEANGIPGEHLAHPRITCQVRIPMLPSRRSMNLTNSASVAIYEAWRQLGFPGAL